MSDERITNLEIALAHQDQQIQDLSEVITAQWKEIERLQHKLGDALSKIDELGQDTPITKPPHY